MSNIISLSQAETETAAFQNATEFQGLSKSTAFDKLDFITLIAQPGCVKVRTYFAIDADDILTVVVVGVNSQGEDITDGIILGDATPCPFVCPINSPLMQ
jgi:hypothetical protein